MSDVDFFSEAPGGYKKLKEEEERRTKEEVEKIKKQEECLKKLADFIKKDKLAEIKGWEDWSGLDFRIDKNKLFQELLSDFVEFYNEWYKENDPLNFKKTFGESECLIKIIQNFQKEKRESEAKQESELKRKTAKEKYKQIDIRFGKPR